MRLSEIKGEEALDMLADLLEPLGEIASDKEFTANLGKNTPYAIKHVLKEHKKAVIAIVAILNKENPDTYEPNLLTLPMMLVEVFNDPQVISLFQSQVLENTETSSKLATENIGVEKK